MRDTAVRYVGGPGPDEHKILNGDLPEPGPRVRRADAHRPRLRELVQNVAVRALDENWSAPRPGQFNLRFHYSPLRKGEIRILRLYQAKHPDEPLRADFFNRQLNDIKGRYEALSYCWGSGAETHEIQIRDLNAARLVSDTSDDEGSDTPIPLTGILVKAVGHTEFKIRKNLYQALNRLRSKYRDVYLWVDAICIDQSENGATEKAHQIDMMARIFNSAANVCVWLGEDYEALAAFNLIREIMNFKNFDVTIRNPPNATALSQLVAILKADWFSRRWIIQEIALSREASIHCGAHSIHWDDFADAVSLLTEKADLMRTEYQFRDETFEDAETWSASTLIRTLGDICRKSDIDEEKGGMVSRLLDVETLVSTLVGFQASFARDTIYSILSLARDYPRVAERWSEKHTEQLEKNKQEKLARIKNDLYRYKEYRAKLEEDLRREKPLHEKREKDLAKLQDDRQRGLEARKKDKLWEVWKLTEIVDKMHELELQGRRYHDLEFDFYTTLSKIRKLRKELNMADQEEARINLLPDYQLSPRDLFIAFVTRSIYQSRSLDIICRHWAPELKPGEGGSHMPSWISSITKAPFGIPGASQDRQAGDNLVACLSYDQRKRYSASGMTGADFQMCIDPLVSPSAGLWTHVDDHPVEEGTGTATPTGPTNTDQAALVSERGESPASGLPDLLGAQTTDNQDSASMVQRHRSIRQAVKDTTKKAINTLNPARMRPNGGGGSPESGRGTPDVQEAETSDRTATPTPRDRTEAEEPPSSSHRKSPSIQLRRQDHPPLTTRNVIQERFAQAAEKTNTDKAAGDLNMMASFRAPDRASPRKITRKKRLDRDDEDMMPPSALHRLSGILVVKGFVLGVIHDQSDVMRGGIIPGGWVSRLGWEKHNNLENSVPDTLWQLLVADRTPQGGRLPSWYKRACLHGLVDNRVSDNVGNIHSLSASDRRISEWTANYFKRVASVVWNRRILELLPLDEEEEDDEEGERQRQELMTRPLYGLGPEGCSKGDYVCILYGCSVPVVLKLVPESAQPRVVDLFEVVGEAYVHGVMDGEAMPADLADLEGLEVDFHLG
ncbi:heterokaryon incompatibility protein-domain-containing protein [Cercophora newfieldiana]|uniref:Heterokaryon incompatibility protein-domain-containing protein n=1 Tax=Cercophora newfieldiana TaxID=92897 RepID=A0AA40D057_9PEZI|nr:heterokaryon incompatibility protein-domain-containing protein [Cercophora newfieldiana]